MKWLSFFVPLLLLFTGFSNSWADHHHETLQLDGVWNVLAETEDNEREIKWTITEEKGKLTGESLDLQDGSTRKLDRITVKGDSVQIETDVEMDGVKGIIHVEAKRKKAGRLEGEWSIVGVDGTEYMSGELFAVKQVQYAGEWASTASLPEGGTHGASLMLKGKNAKLSGQFESDWGKSEVQSIKLTKSGLRMEFELVMEEEPLECVIRAKAKGADKLVGEWSIIGDDGNTTASGDWSAIRKAVSLAGDWQVVATVPDSEDYVATLSLQQKGDKYSGTSTGRDGAATALDAIKVHGKKFEFQVPFNQDGNEGTVTVKAGLQKDGSLDGEWVLTDDSGTEWARDQWKASRKN